MTAWHNGLVKFIGDFLLKSQLSHSDFPIIIKGLNCTQKTTLLQTRCYDCLAAHNHFLMTYRGKRCAKCNNTTQHDDTCTRMLQPIINKSHEDGLLYVFNINKSNNAVFLYIFFSNKKLGLKHEWWEYFESQNFFFLCMSIYSLFHK